MRATLHLLALATLGLAPLAACADATELTPGITCKQANECGDGLACSFNHCVVPSQNPLALQARLTPPPTSGLLPQHIPALDLSAGPDLLVKLLPPTTVRGLVKRAGDTFEVNVPGTLEVRTPGDIADLEFSFSTLSLDGVDKDGYGYTLTVLPGRTYTGTFRPEDPSLPRHVFELGADAIAAGRYDIILPGRSEYQQITGRVMKSDYTPIPGARVVILTSAKEVAGVTTTDEVRGYFEVLLPPSVGEILVKVESPAEGPVFPEFTTELRATNTNTPMDLVVPDLPPGTEPVLATLQVIEQRADDGYTVATTSPAVGRSVTIVGVLAGGTLRRTGVTNDRGEVAFLALPGAYECLVASPSQSPTATWHGYVNLGGPSLVASSTTVITLEPRPPLVGRVTDVFGAPVEAGTITLERRVTWTEGESLVVAPPPFEVPLGADGVFMARVDPGTYDAFVAPELGTGAPHAFETDIVVGPEGLRLDLGLPPPGLLHLTVAGPDGSWLPDVRVELWAEDDLGEPRILALGTTGERGFVDVLVPHTGAGVREALEVPGEKL